MKKNLSRIVLIFFCTAVLLIAPYGFTSRNGTNEQVEGREQEPFQLGERIIQHIVDPGQGHLRFYLKDDSGKDIRSFGRLRELLAEKNMNLKFAMNGGMYRPSGKEEAVYKTLTLGISHPDHSPVGLYIEEGKELSPLDQKDGFGNFYMKPNGVFYITYNNQAGVCTSEEIGKIQNIRFATQSGPMLLMDGEMHPAFKKGSPNLKVRNGVGILPDGKIIFILSEKLINFYDLAELFKAAGCKNALYLDGFVSRMYLPEKNCYEAGGDFGVILGETGN